MGNAGRSVSERRPVLALMLLCLCMVLLASCTSSKGPVSRSKPHAHVTATTTPTPSAEGPQAPVKGLTDNPAYQWWERPNSPEPDSWWGEEQTPQTLQTQVALMRQLGVRVFRVELVWAFVAPRTPGGGTYDSAAARNPNWSGYNWQRWDEIVQLLTQANIEIVPEVVYTPSWAAGATHGQAAEPNTPPASPQYYADFLTAAVSRYQGRIHYWELWNEPDYQPHTWNGNMQQYVDLVLKPGYLAVKQVDPTAQVLLGGLAEELSLKSVYTAGGKPYFDIANFHSYLPGESGVATALEHVKTLMYENGDKGKPIWLSEVGMATHPALEHGDPSAITPENSTELAQAKFISQVYSGIRVQAILFYQLHDTAVYGPGSLVKKYVFWGLVSRDFSHQKAGFTAYQDALSGALAPQSGNGALAVSAAAAEATTSAVSGSPIPGLAADVPRYSRYWSTSAPVRPS